MHVAELARLSCTATAPQLHHAPQDTYRTLSAADNALMLVDAGKGLEPQTRKLFEVCRRNGLPLFTFINKLDREARLLGAMDE